MKTVTKAAIAGVTGVTLLLGGAGTLAFWTDTQAGSEVTIATGNLDLGVPADGSGWALQQNAGDLPAGQAELASVPYAAQLLVPGDTLTKTVDIPIVLTGENNRAQLDVTAANATGVLGEALSAEILTINGEAVTTPADGAATVTLTTEDVADLDGVVSVTYRVALDWADDNTTRNLTGANGTTFQASYTLTQVPENS
jgi:alternate signal-mediated exported protein